MRRATRLAVALGVVASCLGWGAPAGAASSLAGTLVFAGDREQGTMLFSLNLATGEETQLTSGSSPLDDAPAFSPDGSTIAFDRADDGVSIVSLLDVATGDVTSFANKGPTTSPAWSPDGERIAYVWQGRIEIKPLGGGDSVVLPQEHADYPAFSPDGAKIAFSQRWVDGTSAAQIVVANADGSEPVVLTSEGSNEEPSWSPDGSRIAYIHLPDAGTSATVHVMSASDGSGDVALTHSEFDTFPRWSPDGSLISFTYFAGGRQHLGAITPDGTSSPSVGSFSFANFKWNYDATWRPFPSATEVSPGSRGRGAGGVGFEVTGRLFDEDATVSFGDGIDVSSVDVEDPGQLTGMLSIGEHAATGVRDVVVTNGDGSTATCAECFEILEGPQVLSISPSSRARGLSGQTVTIIGSGFVEGSEPSFFGWGITVDSYDVVDASHLTAVLDIAAYASTGTEPMKVTNPDGGMGGCTCFTVNPPPVVTSLEPARLTLGSVMQNVTLIGSGFLEGATVSVGGEGAEVSSVTFGDAAHLTAHVSVDDDAATGPRDVSVQNPDGGGPVVCAECLRVVNERPTITFVGARSTIWVTEEQISFSAWLQSYRRLPDPDACAGGTNPRGCLYRLGSAVEGKPIEFAILQGTDEVASVTERTSEDGRAATTIDYTLAAGNYRVVASFAGDDDYAPSQEGVDFSVARTPTYARWYWGESTQWRAAGGTPAVLHFSLGNAVGRVMTVDFFGDSAEGGFDPDVESVVSSVETPPTDASARTSIALPGDLPAGEYWLRVSFAGDDQYAPSSMVNHLTVLRHTTALTSLVASGTSVTGEATDVQVRLDRTDTSPATPLEGRRILFTWRNDAGATVAEGEVTTDAEGRAAFAERQDDVPRGPTTLSVRFEGDEDFHSTSLYWPTFYFQKRFTTVTYTGSSVVSQGTPATIAARVVDAKTGEPVEGAHVRVDVRKWTGETVASFDGDTDADGRLSAEQPTEEMGIGLHTVAITQDEAGAYSQGGARGYLGVTRPGCESSLAVSFLRISGSCLVRSGNTWKAYGAMRMNGIEVSSVDGNPILVDTKALRVTASRARAQLEPVWRGNVRIGPLVLQEGKISWDFAESPRSAGAGRSSAQAVQSLPIPVCPPEDVTLNGLPLGCSEIAVSADDGGRVEIRGAAKLNGAFGTSPGGLPLAATMRQEGDYLWPESLTVGNETFVVPEGVIKVGSVVLDQGGKWVATVEGCLKGFGECIPGTAELRSTGEGIAKWVARIGVDEKNILIGPGVFLQRASLDLAGSGKPGDPRSITGSATVTAGPQIGGFSAAKIEGTARLVYDAPMSLDLRGTVSILGSVDLADGFVVAQMDGRKVGLGGHADFTLAGFGLEGDLEGWVTPAGMQLEGGATVKTPLLSLGGRALVSTRGIAGCVPFTFVGGETQLGFGYPWGDALPEGIGGSCGFAKWSVASGTTAASGAGASRAADGESRAADLEEAERIFELPEGLPAAAFAFTGEGDPPRVTLVSPNGERFATPEDPADGGDLGQHFVLSNPEDDTTYIVVGAPAAGQWRVETDERSAPIVSVRQAAGIESPSIRAKVTGAGYARRLEYSIAPIEGQGVTFVEEGAATRRELGAAKGSKGTISFVPAQGPAGKRRIVAEVTQDGLPRAAIVVARYSAPARGTLPAPASVGIARRASSIVVSWKAVRGAKSYLVVLVVAGKTRRFTVKRGPLEIKGIKASQRATVSVQAVDSAGLPSPPRSVSIKPRK